MKASSKPISSPSTAEQFLPPLITFLKSRNRGRSRPTPMFASTVTEPIQDPSSPEVTCIGQVRASSSAEPNVEKPGGASPSRRRCWLLKKVLFCGQSPLRFRCRKRSSLCKWGSFLRFGCFKKVDTAEDSFRVCSNQTSAKTQNVGGGSDRNSRSRVDESSSPLKIVSILTRCKSTPHRSLSLRGRFWGLVKLKMRKNPENCKSPAVKMQWKSRERAKKVVKN
ncbi:uncharacterized protein LOC105161486 [Sesamum indicum]|uniref:Uncharacterized protein LOC105161486 n=1 Tax=Sesamum indicum TaxID=4182 RepID=A0A6I9T5R8_SESIN|nr:uncharacterized protein LOC105161486 [Sesamum indicum]